MADYRLTQKNSHRAYWGFDGGLPIQVPGNFGGAGPGHVTIEIPLPFPSYPVGLEATAIIDADILVTPVGDDCENGDWSIDLAGFSQDAQTGYITFTLLNCSAVEQEGNEGNFYVAVNLHRP